MSGPPSGQYQIQLAVGPRPLVGVYVGPALDKPVITGGIHNVWNVGKLDNGNYILTLQDDIPGRLLFMQDINGQLIGTGRAQRPLAWSIERQSDGSYTIKLSSDFPVPKAWTVNYPEQQSPVYLNIFENPQPNQQWNFIPWIGPE